MLGIFHSRVRLRHPLLARPSSYCGPCEGLRFENRLVFNGSRDDGEGVTIPDGRRID
jgi:hypothetical protein